MKEISAVSAELTVKQLESAFAELSRCCLHSPVWTPVDVDKVLCSIWNHYGDTWEDCRGAAVKDGTDSRSYTVVHLKDGRFGLLAESEDYTGHGCQCDAATNAYDSIDELVRLGIEEWNSGARDVIHQRLAVPGAVVTDSGEIEAVR